LSGVLAGLAAYCKGEEMREGRRKNNVTLDNERDRTSSIETQQSI